MIKKIILLFFLFANSLYASEYYFDLKPFFNLGNTNASSENSVKNGSTTYGVYTEFGNKGNYAIEASLSYTKTKYKQEFVDFVDNNLSDINNTIDDITTKESEDSNETDPEDENVTKKGFSNEIKQTDFTLVYKQMITSTAYVRAGFHYTNTDELFLGGGFTAITSIGDKIYLNSHSYLHLALDLFYTQRAEAKDEVFGNEYTITIFQASPIVEYVIKTNGVISDTQIKVNYISSQQYIENYISYEIYEMLKFGDFFVGFEAMGGEMKSGVELRGHFVNNSRDLYQGRYGGTIGYDFGRAIGYIGYFTTDTLEYGFNNNYNTSNFVAIVSMSW